MQDRSAEELHRPVMLEEVISLLEPQRGGLFVDATLGLGGHTEAILGRSAGTNVIGIDQDTEAIAEARKRLKDFGGRLRIEHANFSEIANVLARFGGLKADGILADLGVSSLQFDSETRGFSFRFDAPLDMRMDRNSDSPTAADLLNTWEEEDIANVIYRFGEERFSRRIARKIVERRESGAPVQTTRELARLVESCVRRSPKDKIHPATRTFQALRIAVNDELEILEKFVSDSVELLRKDGRLAIITFHSLEDRIIKQSFQKLSGKCMCPPRIPQCVCGATRLIEILTRKPLVPSEIEIAENPRARSAKLRACRKLP